MKQKNLEIERLRAVAVLMTIIVHAPFKQLFHPYLYSSFTGVDLFFVISGFVVTLSFIPTLPQNSAPSPIARLTDNKDAIIAFYLRRLFRIAPSAFFYIGLYWIVAVVMQATGSNAGLAKPADIFREGIAFAGGIYNYAMVAGAIPTNMSHYYSLSIEEHFYLLAPMLLVLSGTRAKRLLSLSIGAAIVLFIARPLTPGSIANLSHTRFDELFYGAIIALLVNKYKNLNIWHYHKLKSHAENSKLLTILANSRIRALLKNTTGIILCMLLATLPGVINTDILGGGSGQFFFSSAAFCGYAMISVTLVVLASLEKGWILQIPIISTEHEYIGSRSYSLYLGHVLLIEIYNDIYFRFYEKITPFLKLTQIGYAIQFLIFLSTALLLAEITFRTIETPFRKAGAKIIKSYKETSA